MTLKGIDISNWQNGINLNAIDADFVIVKATEGVGWICNTFATQYNAAKAAGRKVGAYHFARPTGSNTPEKEANSFINALNIVGAVGEAVLVLDWEAENKGNVQYAKQFLDIVYEKTGVKPLFYTYENVVRSYDWSPLVNAGYELWIAKYRDNIIDYNYDMSNAGSAPVVKPWPNYIMWQWTSSGRLNGYNGNLDCNMFYGDSNDWNALAGKAKSDEIDLSQYTDDQLADMVIDGAFGSGEARKKALGSRYAAVQNLVNIKLSTVKQTDEVSYYSFLYNGLTIHVGKISKEAKVRGSVDGIQYGHSGDKRPPSYFGDKALENEGYIEATVQNASTFYSWDGATYAEGLEKSKGVNNQGSYLSTVYKFANTMAVGFPYSGGIWFGPQSEIEAGLNNCYGAVTGIFGIIYGGQKNFMGAENNRGGGYTVRSGRSILAEDNWNYYSICFMGNTGSTGLTGEQLYDLCKKVSPNMTNAICFDGGGSVFQRVTGTTTISTTRQVKNAVCLYVKPMPKLVAGAKIKIDKEAWNLNTGYEFESKIYDNVMTVKKISGHRLDFAEKDEEVIGAIDKQYAKLER